MNFDQFLVSIILVALTILILLMILAFVIPVNITAYYDIKSPLNLSLDCSLLKEIIKIYFQIDSKGTHLALFLFNKKFFIKEKDSSRLKCNSLEEIYSLIGSLKPLYFSLYTSYCFNDPSITSTVYNAINLASKYINIDSCENNADFTPSESYLYIYIKAKFNIFITLINYYKTRINYLINKT